MGAPGSGKSTVAALLADGWQVPLIDVDELLTAELGGRLSEAFVRDTERYRQHVEAACLRALSEAGVVALSSAAVESAAVRAELVRQEVIWLRTAVGTITRRLGMNQLGMTELVAIRNRMDEQLQLRARWYASVARGVVDTDRLTAVEVAARITERGAV